MNFSGSKNYFQGDILLPHSKSYSHRILITAAISKGISWIRKDSFLFCDDTIRTMEALQQLGCKIKEVTKDEDGVMVSYLKIKGMKKVKGSRKPIQVGESGSTLRMLMPLALLSNKKVSFIGEGRINERPIDTYLNLFKVNEVEVKKGEHSLPISIKGMIQKNDVSLANLVSSQFVTGLIYYFVMKQEDATITLLGEVPSYNYILMTIDILQKSGADITVVGNQIQIKPSVLEPQTFHVERDFSALPYIALLAVINGNITISDMNTNSIQSDKVFLDILHKFNGKIGYDKDVIHIRKSELIGSEVDILNSIDLGPAIFVLGAISKGETKIYNYKNLIYKESNRLNAMVTELEKLGVAIEIKPEYVSIQGVSSLKSAELDSHNDHRIAMSLMALSAFSKEPITVTNVDCIKKSYPDFINDYNKLLLP